MLALVALSVSLMQEVQRSSPAQGKPAATAAQPSDTIYQLEEVDVQPVVTTKAALKYTEEAITKNITGVVQLRVTIGKDGVPTEVQVLHGLGYGLDENARAAVMQYRFSPAMKNGAPVRVTAILPVRFVLEY